MSDLAILISEYLARTAVLTGLLWGMVRLQKLSYFLPGLLVAAALACALDTIPHFGHYLAVPVLYFCIWKITGASLMPDVGFTVVVSYALMFAVKVLLFGALIGELRPSARFPEKVKTSVAPVAKAIQPAAGTNHIRPVVTHQTVATTNAVTVPTKSADDWLKDVVVKGSTQNGDKSMLLITAGKKRYTLLTDVATRVETTEGACSMRLLNVGETWATVTVNGEAAYLRLH